MNIRNESKILVFFLKECKQKETLYFTVNFKDEE